MKLSKTGTEGPRKYRQRVKSAGLVAFRATVKETDLLVSAERDLTREVLGSIWKYRNQIERYIAQYPEFKETLSPHEVDPLAPRIVREMAEAAKKVGVGPMASVAGAIAEFVGRDLLPLSPQIILENGGDIFVVTRVKRKVSIFTESPSFPSFIDLYIRPEKTPLGICTSSGKEGPSLSLGKADAVMVVSPSAVLADAAATAAGNMVQSRRDIPKTIEFLRAIPQITGAAILADGQIGLWGEIELAESSQGDKAGKRHGKAAIHSGS